MTFGKKQSRRRGSVLILAMGITVVLAGMVLVFTRQMRVEALASGNLVSSLQSDAVIRGAALYVSNRLENNQSRSTLDSEIQSEFVPVGEGSFWLLRPDAEDEHRYGFGVIDESSKLNINTATFDMLIRLPNMSAELAASIIDWRDEDDTVSEGGGAESEHYLLQPDPYYCKNAPFETLEELKLVKGATPEILFGVDYNHNGVVDQNESGETTGLSGLNGQAACGIWKYLTVNSIEPNLTSTGEPRLFVGELDNRTVDSLARLFGTSVPADRITEITTRLRGQPPPLNILDFYKKSGMTVAEFKLVADKITTDRAPVLQGRINVNTAPREVLRCLPGLEDADADALIAKRSSNGPDLDTIAWVADALPAEKLNQIGSAITTRSYQYSADILAASGSGRGFKRVRYVYDLRTTPIKVVYRKDLSHLGWPLDEGIREMLRSGVFQQPGILAMGKQR
ncbi:MAG TPA: type II secretion system protein GspK [Planctomycetota bacterium]|nr:type II secretion system protein GspK [Planctomycetota bacterium]